MKLIIMTMKPLILVFLFGFYACSQGTKKHSIDPEAKKLVDSATHIAMRDHEYARSIVLLDQAIQIDSNYFGAYTTKMTFLGFIKPVDMDKMLETIKKLNQLRPEYPDFYLYLGTIYIKKGDSITAKKYLEDAIVHYNKILDTMHTSNIAYALILLNKGYSLILEDKQQEGKKFLQQAHNNTRDTVFKELIAATINKTRREILDSLSFDK